MQFNFGAQPLSNRYIEKNSFPEKEFKHPFILTQDHLGLVRIKDPIPYNEMNPKFDWLTETEPANHLKTVSAMITDRFSNDSFKSLGLSYRDSQHAEILSDKFGVTEIEFIDYQPLTSNNFCKIETFQHLITEKTDVLIKDYGKFDLILGNRILHHVHQPKSFLSAISNLLTDDGCVFEVPDCQGGFTDRDYTILFEEHTLYFTKTSLFNLLESNGFEVQWCFEYMYPVENSLSILAKKKRKSLVETETNINFEQQYFSYFVEMFDKTKQKIQKYFNNLSKKNRICLFGAGHHGTTFINLFNLSQYFEFVVDDNEMKHDYFLPGTNLEIVGSFRKNLENIDYCFLSVSQVNENKIIKKICYLSNSVKCFSIFPKSVNTFPLEKSK